MVLHKLSYQLAQNLSIAISSPRCVTFTLIKLYCDISADKLQCLIQKSYQNICTLAPEEFGDYLAADIFERIFLKENSSTSFQFALLFLRVRSTINHHITKYTENCSWDSIYLTIHFYDIYNIHVWFYSKYDFKHFTIFKVGGNDFIFAMATNLMKYKHLSTILSRYQIPIQT